MTPYELRGALLRVCHPKQRAFVCDAAKRASACCSRRAGKSTGILVKHTLTALDHPQETSFYINRSVAAGVDVLSPALRGLRRAGVELGIVPRKLNGRTYWIYPNGHRIWIAGCRDRSEIDNFRGQPPPRVTIDEAQQFTFLRELIEDAIEPSLLDWDGSLDLIGTPDPIPEGPFFDASRGMSGYSPHHWTMRDNTYLPDVAAWTARLLARNGWTERTPRYRREYLGEWVLDGDALVYPLTRERNGWVELPRRSIRRVLGVDLGASGVTALVVVCTAEGVPGYWVEWSESHRDASVSDVCAAVARVQMRYGCERVIVDAGGLGGAYVRELNSRHGINATAARKQDKRGYIEHCRSDIISGLFHVADSCVGIWDEACKLQWNESRQDYDERSADHHLDAMLYAWRYLRPESEREDPPILEPGTPEFAEAEARHIREARLRQVAMSRSRR